MRPIGRSIQGLIRRGTAGCPACGVSHLSCLLALAASTTGSAQAQPGGPAVRVAAPAVGYALNDWRTLRQSSGYPFANYASFLIANPDWPEEDKLRRWAEAAMRPGENAATILNFFSRKAPESGNGWARLADANAQYGRSAEALAAARRAWVEADLPASDEQALYARYGANFTRADHDQRVDALLFAKKPSDAYRFVAMATPTRQAAFHARVGHAIERRRRRGAIPARHRAGDERRGPDDGPRPLPARQQLQCRGAAACGATASVHLSARRRRALLRDAVAARQRSRRGARFRPGL